MTAQLMADLPMAERLLLETVRDLPSQRVAQVLDFARWLRTQSTTGGFLDEDMPEFELEAEEAAWEATYEANKESFRAMARQALIELDAGKALEMTLADGKIRPR